MARRNASRRTARRSKRTRNRSHQSHSFAGRSLYHRSLRLEPLEERRLLAVVTVTTLSDTVDFTDGVTSLREAIFATNIVPGTDTINFAPALTAGGPAKILLTQGELAITDPLTIQGPGADALTIDAQQQSRIFDITATAGDYIVAGLTLTGGQTTGNNSSRTDTTYCGGAVRCLSTGTLTMNQDAISASGTTGVFAFGGGVFSVGGVIINNSSVDHNSTAGGQAGGGGVSSIGNVTLNDSIVSNNTTAQFFASGGGIRSGGTLTLNHSTVIGNSAPRGSGGGIAAYLGGTLDRSTITGNSGLSGGIYAYSGAVTLIQSIVSGNVGTGAGGGVYSGNCTLTLNESDLSGNVAVTGGGICSRRGGSVTLNDSTVNGNQASMTTASVFGARGGGIYSTSRVVLNQSTVSGNSADGDGGGIYSANFLTLNDSTVSGNSADGDGGGIHSQSYPVSLSRSTVSGNSAVGNGGGVFSRRGPTLKHSTVSGNSAGGSGGGIWVLFGTSVSDSTIAENSAGGFGGGIWISNNYLGFPRSIAGSIVAGNSAGSGNPDLELGTSLLTIAYSLIGDNSGSSLVEAPVGLPDANGNLIGGPVHGVIDPKLGPLADNGGFTLPDGSHILTHALLPGSPAINAGDLNAVAGQNGVPEFDQRGTPFGRVVGGRIDIGAFEYQAPSDLNLLVDTLVDESDGNFARGDLSLREAIELANMYPGADTIHFDPALTAGGPATILMTQDELAITDALTINGPGASLLTIDAQQQSRIFNITATTGDYTIAGLMLTGGKTLGSGTSSGGGAIRSLTTDNLTIDKSSVSGNDTSDTFYGPGGGVFAKGNVMLLRSTVSGNKSWKGGGVYAVGETTVVASTISNNSCVRYGGGGIYSKGDVTLTDSTVSGNNSGGSFGGGGGLFSRADVTLLRSTVSANTAPSGGGVNASGAVTLDHSAVSDNSGGGIIARGIVTVNESTVTGNSTAGKGGGIFSGVPNRIIPTGSVTVNRSTVSGNSAGTSGGGVYCTGNVTINASAVSGNGLRFADSGFGGGGVFALGDVKLNQSFVIGNSISGTSSGGGAGICARGSVTIDESTVSDNSATYGGGGGVLAFGNVVVTGSIVSGNTGYNGGGIIGVVDVTLNDSVVSRNTTSGRVGAGGGVLSYGTVLINRTTVSGNSTTGSEASGGGIFAYRSISLNQSEVNGNSTSGVYTSAGGIFCFGSVMLVGSTISDNHTVGGGGGIDAGGAVTILSSTISGNSATLLGGGIWTQNGTSTIAYSTIYGNHAGAAGGGVFIGAGTLNLDHTIVAVNFSLAGNDASGSVGAVIDAHYSLIGTNGGSGFAPAPVGSPDANGNLIGGTNFDTWIGAKLGPLVYNGGPVFLDGSRLLTHALLPGSPAIDAGDPSVVAGIGGVPVNDQRGAPFSRVFGGRIDIGAVESQPNPLPGDYNFNCVVDAADYTLWRDTLGSVTDLRADGDGNGVVNQLDYDVWKANFGQTLTGAGAAIGARGEERGASVGTWGKAGIAVSSQLLAVSQTAGGSIKSGSAIRVGSAAIAQGGQSPFSIGADLGQGFPAKMRTDSGRRRAALGALSVPPNGSADFGELSRAGASRSRFAGASQDEALLVWLSSQPDGGPRRDDSARRALSPDQGADEAVDSLDVAVDDVFAGLAVNL